MNASAMQLPWTMKNVPHAVLDILRGCNVRCRDCYNLQPDYKRPLAEIETQLDELLRLRQLHSVSIVGGEITLHPDLVEIVRCVRRRGLFVELFTNGVALNERLLTELKQAGANLIFLHIEPDQRRADLPINSTADDLRKLRESKVAIVAAHGIEVGLAVTIYPDKLAELEEAVRFALAPITLDSNGVGKMVSVLVSVADALPLKPLLHPQFRLEARVGIGRVPPSTSHSKSTV